MEIPTDPSPIPTPTSSELMAIHQKCNFFEASWNTPTHATIEQIVAHECGAFRTALLESLIRSELELRAIELSKSVVAEYHKRFPNDPNAVMRALRPLEEMERLDASTVAVSISETDMTYDDPPEAVAMQDSMGLPNPFGPYEILETIASGGMGIVYRARHKQLDRIVALKVIKSGQFASPSELTRFRTEAQVVATLDHPNIVPVFDVGEFAGFHYFSMPLIVGKNLAELILERPLEPRDAAGIARQIAVAVQYAHDHGIIHRDLKPRNILLETNGTVRVSDFGLAKIVKSSSDDPSEHLTLTGEVVGTPAFMAPEQALGKPCTQSDTYAIGAVLYTMLTGRPPFQAATVVETIRQLQETEPVEPRRLNSQVPKDLNTISLHCLRKNPESRYAQPRYLAEDLSLYLDNLPITARPISRFSQLLRWMKRQPVVASLMAAILFSLSAGIAVSWYYYSMARQGELRATQNFETAIATVKKYLSEVAASPELKEQGLEQLRKKLLSNAQNFYLQLEQNPTSSSDLQDRISDTHYNLALISHEMGELSEAKSEYDIAIEALRQRSNKEPEQRGLQRVLARCLKERATLWHKIERNDQIEPDFKSAIDLYKRAYDTSHSVSDRIQLASARVEYGNFLLTLDRAKDEQSEYEQVQSLCNDLSPDDIPSIDEAKDLLRVYELLALDLQLNGRFGESEKWFLASLDVIQKFLKTSPEDTGLVHQLARANKSLTLVYARMQQFDKAAERFHAANAEFGKLTQEHPLVFTFLDGRATNLLTYGSMEYQRGNISQSEKLLQECMVLEKEMVRRQPDVFDHRLSISVAHSTYATVLVRLGRVEEAMEQMHEGIDSLAIATRIRPDDLDAAYAASIQKNNLANVLRAQNKLDDASTMYEASIAMQEELWVQKPQVAIYPRTIAINLFNLANVRRKLGQFDASELAARRCIELNTRMLSETPGVLDYLIGLSSAQNELGETLFVQSRFEEAEKQFGDSKKNFIELTAKGQDPNRFIARLAHAIFYLGKISLLQNRFEDALSHFDRCVELQRQELALREPSDPNAAKIAKDALCNMLRDKGQTLASMKRLDEAVNVCKQGGEMDAGVAAQANKALYARLLAALNRDAESRKVLEQVDLLSELSAQGNIDFAAAAVRVASRVDEGRERWVNRAADALKLASAKDPRLFHSIRDDAEFAALEQYPQLLELWSKKEPIGSVE